MTTKLPRIALDPLSLHAGEVELGGKVYPVLHVTAKAFRGSRKLQEDETRRKGGEQVAYDLDLIFEMARSLVPAMPVEVADSLTADQAVAILGVANGSIAEVEKLYPKAKAGASRPTRSRR